MNSPAIDWEARESHLLLNPHWPLKLRDELSKLTERERQKWPELIWLATSGTTRLNSYKLVGLSRQAFLSSAQAVNEHLQVQSQDRWLCALPLFHVGGLSIFARSYLQQGVEALLWPSPWNPKKFTDTLKEQMITLSALVPTQVYDLVGSECRAPGDLRAVVVGGGALGPKLYQRARALGWPLLPSYGLTECASQVATAELTSLARQNRNFNSEAVLPALKKLSHIQWELSDCKILRLKSPSLLTVELEVNLSGVMVNSRDPKIEGWYETEDQVELAACDTLRFLGRLKDTIKVSGELVNLMRLNLQLEELLLEKFSHLATEFAIVAHPCVRRGHELVLLSSGKVTSVQDLEVFDLFNSSVLPYERVSQIEKTLTIQRNQMGKRSR